MIKTAAPSQPMLLSIKGAAHEWGGLGQTSTYRLIEKYHVQIVKIGARSMIPRAEVERVVEQLIEESHDRSEARAKAVALAKIAVKSRRKQRAAKADGRERARRWLADRRIGTTRETPPVSLAGNAEPPSDDTPQ